MDKLTELSVKLFAIQQLINDASDSIPGVVCLDDENYEAIDAHIKRMRFVINKLEQKYDEIKSELYILLEL